MDGDPQQQALQHSPTTTKGPITPASSTPTGTAGHLSVGATSNGSGNTQINGTSHDNRGVSLEGSTVQAYQPGMSVMGPANVTNNWNTTNNAPDNITNHITNNITYNYPCPYHSEQQAKIRSKRPFTTSWARRMRQKMAGDNIQRKDTENLTPELERQTGPRNATRPHDCPMCNCPLDDI